MKEQFFLSTGRAGTALGVSADAIRRLCEAGAIQAEMTPGGQWRVSVAEIERLKAVGLPPVPRPMPGQSGRPNSHDTGGSQVSGPALLLADPSQETIDAADEVVRLENEVRALGLKRQREEALDWFRQREEEEEAEIAAVNEQADGIRAEHEAGERRRRFEARWLEHAIADIPREAQGEVELAIHREVRKALETLDSSESHLVVGRIVDGVVAKLLRPWRWQAEVADVVAAAVKRLPYSARGIAEPTRWELRAATQARAAVDQLRVGAPRQALEKEAEDAVKRVEAEFDAHQAAEADAEVRERLLMWLPFVLRDFTEEGQAIAREAVHRAWAALAVGTAREQLVEARDAALAPFRAALAQRQEVQRLEVEAAQRKLWTALESQLRRSRAEPLPTVTTPRRPASG